MSRVVSEIDGDAVKSHSGMNKRRIIKRTKSEKGRVIISRATRHQSRGARGAKGETREGITLANQPRYWLLFYWTPIIQQEKR
jgi:hypothetical protein